MRRVSWWSLALGAACVVLIARWLDPDPSGHGTHTQLGLPACGFFLMTSLPCPGCGLTTSFAHMARFDLVQAFASHPIGVPLFLLTAFGWVPRVVEWH